MLFYPEFVSLSAELSSGNFIDSRTIIHRDAGSRIYKPATYHLGKLAYNFARI
jgi:hypothetical protein